MKALFVAHSGEICGGANRSLLSLMTGLREQYGIEPSVLVPGAGTPLASECKALKIPVYTGTYHTCCTVFQREPKDILRLAKLLAGPALDRLSALALSRKLPRDFDLIYTNDRMTCVGAYLARLRGKPHVWHARSFGRETGVRFPPFWYSRMNRLSDRIVVVSQALFEDFLRHTPVKKLRMVYNGIEPERYLISSRLPHSGFRLLLAGRLTPSKGQEDAIRALDILVRHYGIDARLFLAGSVPAYESPAWCQRLKAIVQSLGLESRVCFLGEVEDMDRIRQETDAELICSWREPFGRVTVEAMMAGLPAVGTRSGGTAEIILDGQTGFLYPPGDFACLAERLKQLHDHPDMAAAMGRAGQRRALSAFTLDQTLSGVMEVLHELR